MMASIANAAALDGLAWPEHKESALDAALGDLMCFALGFMAIRFMLFSGAMPRLPPGAFEWPRFRASGNECSNEAALRRRVSIKCLCASATAGQYDQVLEIWDREKSSGPLPGDALCDVARAAAELAPERLLDDLAKHLARHPHPREVLDDIHEVIVSSGYPELAARLLAEPHGDRRTATCNCGVRRSVALPQC